MVVIKRRTPDVEELGPMFVVTIIDMSGDRQVACDNIEQVMEQIRLFNVMGTTIVRMVVEQRI